MARFDDLISGFRSTVFPTSQGARLDRAQAAAGTLASFRQSILEKMQQGLRPEAALAQTLADPTQQQVLSQPNFPKNNQEFMQLFQAPPEEFGTVGAGSSVFSKTTGKLKAQAPSEPTAAERLTDAILATDDPEKKKLLVSQLPRDPAGRLSVTDYVKVIASGATVDTKQSPLGVTMTQDQAASALALGRATGARAPSDNDLILRGLGQKTGTVLDSIDPVIAEGAAIIKEQLRTSESQNILDSFLAATPGAAGLIPEKPGVEALFKRFREGKEAPGPQVPLAPPVVGGVGGQAAGPQITLEQLQALPVENFAELSPETLASIVQGLESGQLSLSEEQKRALLEALQALSGGADGGAQ